MRLAVALAVVSLVVLAAASAGYWRAVNAALPANPVHEAQRLEAGFVAAHAPLTRLELAALTDELLDPGAALPQTQRYAVAEVRALHAYERSCAAEPAPPPVSPALAKAWAWARARCSGATLPESFFEAPPYLHPSGRSFVQLAAQAQHAVDPAWWPAHRRLAHVSEWRGADLTLVERLLAAGGPSLWRAVVAREPLVLATDHLLRLERASGAPGSQSRYAVYDRRVWDEALASASLRLVSATGAPCVVGGKSSCWVEAGRAAAPVRALGLTAAVSLAVLSAALSALALGRRRAARRELEDRLFILRTLAHELRTPATAISLDADELRRDLDALPESSKVLVLRLVDQVQRLRRVLEVTSRFLRLHRGEERVDLVAVPSLNELVAEVAREHGVDWVELAPDAAVRTDPRWLRVCLDNLLANANAHGAPPYGITLRREGAKVAIEVRDAGDTTHLSLRDMTTAFYRGPNSRGLGLGLSIVHQVVAALGGELSHRASPTTFVVRLPA